MLVISPTMVTADQTSSLMEVTFKENQEPGAAQGTVQKTYKVNKWVKTPCVVPVLKGHQQNLKADYGHAHHVSISIGKFGLRVYL